ncbi:hypothetical protein HYH02_015164 [Chlamydomonas schloesseri]|uniref:RRM domain-containing protein n=1 Tax=Chlamydomonas schloesseri TaxID=2026947 RepID=A0A835SBZ5_9CHLO|nr:hypothetical protein HYH02_015164 [Chlamydomonas schloesseri]|eukprot:KAG2424492.1 hypothetical protein HYH02_015164 [Chlamydomonas schloesseri]
MQGNLANISEASEHLPDSLSPTGTLLGGAPQLAGTVGADQRSGYVVTELGIDSADHSPRQDAATGVVIGSETGLAERMSGGSGVSVSVPSGTPAEEAEQPPPPQPGHFQGNPASPGLVQYGPLGGAAAGSGGGVSSVRAAPVAPPPPPTQPHPGQPGEPQPSQQLWDELRQRDAQILVLQKKLAHFRSWLAGVHAKVQAANPSAINNYKRLYVGNLPPHTTEEDLKAFLHGLMVRTGANAAPGNAILSCKLKSAPGAGGGLPPPGLPPGPPDKHYAFIELRSVEEASNAMAFDGVAFRNAYLKVRRPSNYDVATAMMLGPTTPDPTIDLSQLEICRTVVENSPHKLFVGGLPCEWSEDMVKELLAPYGTLKSFNLVMDKSTGKSKGYAFCEYSEDSSADLLIKNLHMRRVGSKALTVKRAMEGNRSAAGSMGGSAAGGGGGGGSGGSSGGGAPPLTLSPAGHSGSLHHTPLGGQHLGAHHSHATGSIGSPPPLPLTPVGVAAMAKLASTSPAAPSTASPAQQHQHQHQHQHQQAGAASGAAAAAAAAAAAMAAALGGVGPDTSSQTALQVADAITALLQQHSGHLASRNLLAAAAAAAAAAGGGHPPGTPPPQPGAASTAAGIAAALQQFQRSAELAGSGAGTSMAGGTGASSGELQAVGSRGQGHPHQHHQYAPHQHAHAHHQHQQQQQQQEAAAAAAAAQEAAQQQFAAAAAAAQQQGVGPFDLSGLTGQGMGFW